MPIELPPLDSTHYAELSDLQYEVGSANLLTYADVNSTSPTVLSTESAANVEDALSFADDFIDTRLRAADYTVPLVALAGATLPTALLRNVARKLAAWQLYQIRGMDDTTLGGKFQAKYDWAAAELDRLIVGGIDGEVVDDALAALRALSPAGAGLSDADCACQPCDVRWTIRSCN
jgi:hypothetical protein